MIDSAPGFSANRKISGVLSGRPQQPNNPTDSSGGRREQHGQLGSLRGSEIARERQFSYKKRHCESDARENRDAGDVPKIYFRRQ